MTANINLTINGKPVTVPKGTTVYHAAKDNGIEIPIFCYQDRMPPFGACRMCLVEVEKSPKLQTSCTLEAGEGMVVNTLSEKAVKGREGILELLLINHPLDCPICDKGGECPLQDNVLKHGPGISEFYEEKRHFKKAYSLGPVLKLDRERCIICARCTRFGDIIAGDHALEFIDRGFKTEVGTPDGGPAVSKFIGNTIQLCPVGALTSDVYRFRARPWDNDVAETTCTLCPVGCSMFIDSRDGEIMRTRARDNREVNDVWLCDKGWFGYEYSSHIDRLQQPLIRKNDALVPATWEEAFSLIVSKIQEYKTDGKLAGLGGNPLTIEENFLFQRLMREGAGVNHVDHRVGSPIFNLENEGLPPGMEMTIGECEKLSFVYLFGIDLTEEFPVIWLRLRQAINKGAKVIFVGHYAPEIAQHLTKTVLHAPGKELDNLPEHFSEIKGFAGNGKGAIFIGRQYLATENRREILAKFLELRKSTDNITLNLLEGSGNSMGARFAGMHPELEPEGKSLAKPGLSSDLIMQEAASNGWDFIYVAGADLVNKYPSKIWKEVRAKLKFLVVQDLFLTDTAKQADIVLPTLSYVEKEGTFMNIERRLQKLNPGKDIPANIYSDGEIFTLLSKLLSISTDDTLPKQVSSEYVKNMRPSSINSSAMAVPLGKGLKATFSTSLFDHGVRMRHNSHVVNLAKEPKVRIHPRDAIHHDFKENDSVMIGSINGRIQFDSQVAEGTVVLPLGFPEFRVHELGLNLMNGMNVELTHGS
jgi:NADH-quinone oxidoreductase subunit G